MATNSTSITVTVDSKEYTINQTKMPYFASQTSINHADLPHFVVALACVEGGFHLTFDNLKTGLSSYPLLCNTLKRLGVDVLGSRSLAEIIAAVKYFKFNDDTSRKANTNQATDAIFKLLYMHYTGVLLAQARGIVFDVVMFIVAHRFFYGAYARNAVRETFVSEMNLSPKQRAAIAKWPVYDDNGSELGPYVGPDDDSELDDDGDGYDSETGMELDYVTSGRSDYADDDDDEDCYD